ncbi:MAG: hypothetical protein ACLQOO_20825 [Terriglobia bacterium]
MTVYVLGAGASRHAGYPLASQMATELFAWMRKFPADSIYPHIVEKLLNRFGSNPDIEDVITDLQESVIKNLEDRYEYHQLRECRNRLVYASREWFRQIHTRPAPGYASFADGIVRLGDVVVTFNYDDSLESELRRAGKWDIHRGYGFPVGDGGQSPTIVLKLHGSINWMVSMFEGKTSGTAILGSGLPLGSGPLIPQPDLEYLGYDAIPGHHFPDGGAFPALIMPGRRKKFFFETSLGAEWTDFWDGLWSMATDALRTAEELVVCGYSLLPADERACDLILRVPKKDVPVTVVSGDQSDRIAEEFRQNGFSNVRSEQNQFFEDWAKIAGRESRR